MRWERLFEDIEAQWAAQERRDRDSAVAERTRRTRSEVGLGERLAAHVGSEVGVRMLTGEEVAGRLVGAGADWVLVEPAPGRRVLVPLHAVVAVSGLGLAAGADGRRLGLAEALRGLSTDRRAVAVTDAAGRTVTGTIDAVWSDCLDLSEHAPDVARRAENIRGRRTVPFHALTCVRST